VSDGEPNRSFWANQRVWLSGHTGFKGAWLAEWLLHMGAEVHGFALAPQHERCPHLALGHDSRLASERHADLRDRAAVEASITDARPTIVLHLAAQALVRAAYRAPVETFATNVLGTVHVLDALRRAPELDAAVFVTTDKVYENREWAWGYRESDRLGGHDPYAASKAACEIAIASYRDSFFDRPTRLPSARAGNVIGGGDWAAERLLPDCMRAFAEGRPAAIRRPHAIRPWQHVVEPLRGYLMLAERAAQDALPAAAYNFGPDLADCRPVAQVVQLAAQHWGGGAGWNDCSDPAEPMHETHVLRLDASLAREIGWKPRIDLSRAVGLTVEWYRAQHEGADRPALIERTRAQIDQVSAGTSHDRR